MKFCDSDVIRFGEQPFYNEKVQPYKRVNGETLGVWWAQDYLRQGPKFCKNGRVSAKYLKAKMVLRHPLTFGEIKRLQRIQANANGYGQINKDFNIIDLSKYEMKPRG